MELIDEALPSSSPDSIDLSFVDDNDDKLSSFFSYSDRPLAFLSSPNNSPTFNISSPRNSIHDSDEKLNSSRQSPEIIDISHSPLSTNQPIEEIYLSDSSHSSVDSFIPYSVPKSNSKDEIFPIYLSPITTELDEETESLFSNEKDCDQFKQEVNSNYLSSDDIIKISLQLKINNAVVESLVNLQNEGFDDMYIRTYCVGNVIKGTYEEVCKILDYIKELKIARERIEKLKEILSYEDWIDFEPLFMKCSNIFDVQKVLIGLPRGHPDYELIFEGLKASTNNQTSSNDSFNSSLITSSQNLSHVKMISDMILKGEIVSLKDYDIEEDEIVDEIKRNIIRLIMKNAKIVLEGSNVEMEIKLNEEALRKYNESVIHSEMTKTVEINKDSDNLIDQETNNPRTSNAQVMCNYTTKESFDPESKDETIDIKKVKSSALFFEDRFGSVLPTDRENACSFKPVNLSHLKDNSHGPFLNDQYPRKICSQSFPKKVKSKFEHKQTQIFKNMPSTSKFNRDAHSKFQFSSSSNQVGASCLFSKKNLYKNFTKKNFSFKKAGNKEKEFLSPGSHKSLFYKSHEFDNSKFNEIDNDILISANDNQNHNSFYPISEPLKTIKNEHSNLQNKCQHNNFYFKPSEFLFRNLCTSVPITCPPPLHIVPPMLHGELLGILSIYLLLKDEMKMNYNTYISNLYYKAPPHLLSECVIQAWNAIERSLCDYIRWEIKEKAFKEVGRVWSDWLKNIVRGNQDNTNFEIDNLSKEDEISEMKIWLLPLKINNNIGFDGGFSVIGIWISQHEQKEGYKIDNLVMKMCVISPWGKVLEKNGEIKSNNLDDMDDDEYDDIYIGYKIKKKSKSDIPKKTKKVINSDWNSFFIELNRLLNKYECDVIGIAGDKSYLFERKLKNAKVKGFFNKTFKWIKLNNVGLGCGLSECNEEMLEKLYYPINYIISQDNLSEEKESEIKSQLYDDVEVNVARRVQYPLRELIGMNGKNIGGFKWLNIVEDDLINKFYVDTMREIINERGVDVNTANWQLLRHVPGVSGKLAFDIIQHRENNGVFMSKRDYKNIKFIKPLALTQCSIYLLIKPVTAGLLFKTSSSRYLISSSDKYNIWDSLMIRPDDYIVADALCNYMSLSKSEVGTLDFRNKCKCIWEHCDEKEMADFCSSSIFTLRYLVKQLIKFNQNLIT